MQTYLRDIEKLQYDNQEFTAQIIQANSQLDRERIEKDTMGKQLREVREDSRRRIDALERRNQELESDNQRLVSQIKGTENNKKKQNDQADEIKHLELNQRHVDSENKALEEQLRRVQDGKIEAERRLESLRREIDMLTQDKTYLSREGASLEDKNQRLEDKLDRTEQSLLESKKQCEKYMDRVLNTNDDLKLKFDQAYSNEI